MEVTKEIIKRTSRNSPAYKLIKSNIVKDKLMNPEIKVTELADKY
jgi:hypothetical protein